MDNDALSVFEVLDVNWQRAVDGVTLEMVEGGGLQHKLLTLSQMIEGISREMRERRHKVTHVDPWTLGLLLAWMGDVVVDMGTGASMTRFEVFQASGFWSDIDYELWADDLAGVARTTWRNWRRNARTWLIGAAGREYLVQLGMTPREFVERVSHEKALRAASVAAVGRLEEHQIEALTDDSISVDKMRLALSMTPEEWKAEQAAAREQDDAWVQSGDGKLKVWFDRAQRTIRIGYIDGGSEWVIFTVGRLPTPANKRVGEVQERIVRFCENMKVRRTDA